MAIVVDVTQEDITLGDQADCSTCPLARAIERHYPGSLPHINAQGLDMTYRGRRLGELPVTEEAVQFMDAYDANKQSVRPGTVRVSEVELDHEYFEHTV